MNNKAIASLKITKHAAERFIERTNSPMALENAKLCIQGLLSQLSESDLIQWDERSSAIRNLFGVFIITANHIVIFI